MKLAYLDKQMNKQEMEILSINFIHKDNVALIKRDNGEVYEVSILRVISISK